MIRAAAMTGLQEASLSGSGTKSTSLDYDAFLKLLVAEMQHQDPTKPMDATEYVAQLATFSNVEQSMKTNAKLDNLMTTQMLGLADQLIGRTITSPDGSLKGEVVAVRILNGTAIAELKGGGEIPLGPGIVIT